jgi:hypothetical protein
MKNILKNNHNHTPKQILPCGFKNSSNRSCMVEHLMITNRASNGHVMPLYHAMPKLKEMTCAMNNIAYY